MDSPTNVEEKDLPKVLRRDAREHLNMLRTQVQALEATGHTTWSASPFGR